MVDGRWYRREGKKRLTQPVVLLLIVADDPSVAVTVFYLLE
jgi:hypothetical protein